MVHVLVDVVLEKVFKLRQIRKVDLNGLFGEDFDSVLAHLR